MTDLSALSAHDAANITAAIRSGYELADILERVECGEDTATIADDARTEEIDGRACHDAEIALHGDWREDRASMDHLSYLGGRGGDHWVDPESGEPRFG